ncbi:hypothetical protein ACE1TI_03000 [Alteribacillus sp. JSM 102045]|uniref:hypothetical protein n=1 Tax=Alteribacillus sp. JSM 102045 TaxID=1562101 RepID=UPI0035C1BCC5
MHLGLAIIIFLLSFIVFFIFIVKSEKKENHDYNEKYLLSSVVASAVLSLISTAIIMFFVFIFTGAAAFINSLFSLDIDKNQLGTLVIATAVYMFTADHLFTAVIKYITESASMRLVFLFALRFIFIFIVCLFLSISSVKASIISLCLAVFLLLVEIIYHSRKSDEKN